MSTKYIITAAADETERGARVYVADQSVVGIGRVASSARHDEARTFTEAEAQDLCSKLVRVSGGVAWKVVPA